jgi:flagellar basal body-associated protein FliL
MEIVSMKLFNQQKRIRMPEPWRVKIMAKKNVEETEPAERSEEKSKDAESEQKPTGKKPSKKIFFMKIGGIFLVLVLLGAGGFIAVKSMMAPSEAAETAEVVEPKDEKGESDSESTGIYYSDFEAFITVLASSEEYEFTYLKFVPKLELSDEEALLEVTENIPQIEDKINALMTDLDWGTVKSEKGRERQADKIKKKLNGLLESGEVVKVYFTTFVAQ